MDLSALSESQGSAMHRKPLLDLLEAYAEAWPNERDCALRILSLVQDHPDCFERSCRPGHITASAWVISADASKHLLVHHRKLNKWLQPGGHADGDPDCGAVALKEAQEESGIAHLQHYSPTPIDLDVHLIPARKSADGQLIEDAHEHHDIRFLIQATTDAAPVVSHESNEVGWFTEEEVLERTQEVSVVRLLRKTQALLSENSSSPSPTVR